MTDERVWVEDRDWRVPSQYRKCRRLRCPNAPVADCPCHSWARSRGWRPRGFRRGGLSCCQARLCQLDRPMTDTTRLAEIEARAAAATAGPWEVVERASAAGMTRCRR